MATADEEFLKAFHQALADKPLEPDDPWYVPIYAKATADPVQRMAQKISWSLESTQLFGGFRGTGKSTELRRLRQDLERDGSCKVVLCDMKHYLNLSTPIDISDFLISAAGALSDALAQDPELLGEDLAQRGYWQRAMDFLRRTQIEASELSASPANLKLGLHEDPSFREKLQAQMKGHLGALVNDVREFMADCVKAIRRKHGADVQLVVLFDSIEQIRGTSVNEDAVFASVETLFAGHPDKLRFESMHVIYTAPPWLKIQFPGVVNHYDGAYLLPCVKVRHHRGGTDEEGVQVLRDIVKKRGDWTRLFARADDFDHVLLATGGYLRDLFRGLMGMLMNAAQHGLPLTREAVDLEIAELRNHYLPIAGDDAAWLWQIATSHDAELPEYAKLPRLARYFDTHLLLCYRNGEEWYDLHPLIRDAVEKRLKISGRPTDG
ncbi:hypothetical protein ACNOYE_01755 [Nannocystaceae bacterium ST9]